MTGGRASGKIGVGTWGWPPHIPVSALFARVALGLTCGIVASGKSDEKYYGPRVVDRR
jgi:hypothetical protein